MDEQRAWKVIVKSFVEAKWVKEEIEVLRISFQHKDLDC